MNVYSVWVVEFQGRMPLRVCGFRSYLTLASCGIGPQVYGTLVCWGIFDWMGPVSGLHDCSLQVQLLFRLYYEVCAHCT